MLALQVRAVPWQEPPQPMAPIYRGPASPHFKRGTDKVKLPCNLTPAPRFGSPRLPVPGVESRKLPARVLHVQTRQSHRNAPSHICHDEISMQV